MSNSASAEVKGILMKTETFPEYKWSAKYGSLQNQNPEGWDKRCFNVLCDAGLLLCV